MQAMYFGILGCNSGRTTHLHGSYNVTISLVLNLKLLSKFIQDYLYSAFFLSIQSLQSIRSK